MSQTVAGNPVDKQGNSGRPGLKLNSDANLGAVTEMPKWLPEAVRLYLDHTEQGISLRALARREGCHASTVMRQVRRYENRRDDPLVDEALGRLGLRGRRWGKQGEGDAMSVAFRKDEFVMDEQRLREEAGRVLRHMLAEGAVLAIAADMDKAMVMRVGPQGKAQQLVTVERAVAQAFALKEWILCQKAGRVATYGLTASGRMMVRRLAEAAGQGMPGDEEEGPRRGRYGSVESPAAVLGRRQDKAGKPFLEPSLVQVAERIHEDFELAQIGVSFLLADWAGCITGGKMPEGAGQGPLSKRAGQRVAEALGDLGPGLGEVVLLCCCYHEGLEAAEQRMGWAARSGKIVLRIALQRLRRHYDETYGPSGPMIG